MLHWKITQWIFSRTKVLWCKLSSLAHILQCVDFTCLLSLLFPCRDRGYVHLSLFQSKGWTSRSKGIAIVKYIVWCYSFCQSRSAESDWCHKEIDRFDRLLIVAHFPFASPYVSGCQVPPEGGQPWRSWLRKTLSLGRPLGPWDSTRGPPAFCPASLNPLFIMNMIRRYSSSVMYQTTNVSANRPSSGCTKSLSQFD